MKRNSGQTTSSRWVSLVIGVVALGLCVTALHAPARASGRLISQQELHRVGLTRAWFAQVNLNPARNHVERAILTGDRLTVLTSAGVVQEFNAETGQTLWSAQIGNENYPSLGPTANDKFVALVNGSTLYVLDRTDGRPTIIRQVGGAPGAAPALADEYVFVPLVKGRIEGYPLATDSKTTPWYYQASGRMMVPPLATPSSLVFTTDLGYLYVGYSDKPGMRFRLETGSEIVAPPTYQKPFVYVASTSGEVFAMQELTGARRWKYATGFPIERAAAPAGKRVFITSVEPALHCVDAVSGDRLWETPHMKQFAAASNTRVYGVDDLGGFVVLNGASGAVLGRIVTDHPIQSLVNNETDRVYLVSAEGVVECLHEIDAKTPLRHNLEPAGEATKPDAAAKGPAPAAQPAATAPTDETSPFDEASPPAKRTESPAGEKPVAPEKPPGDFGVPDDENPFGG